MLNVVNFGGGAYVLYAEVLPNGEIEVDPEPYSDTFDRPARLLPIEARALLAAIELLGVHLSEAPRHRAREARARARRHRQGGPAGLQRAHGRRDRPSASARRSRQRRLIELEYYARQRGPLLHPRRGALRADERARGLVRGDLRSRQGRDAPLPARPGQARRRARRGLRAARRPRPGRRRGGLAAHRRGRAARASRTCGSRPSRRAGRARSAPCWPSSTTAP